MFSLAAVEAKVSLEMVIWVNCVFASVEAGYGVFVGTGATYGGGKSDETKNGTILKAEYTSDSVK